jgi:hypothetical protein
MSADRSLFYFICFIFIFHWKLSFEDNNKCLLVVIEIYPIQIFVSVARNDHLFYQYDKFKKNIGYNTLRKYIFSNVKIREGTTGYKSDPAITIPRAKNFLVDFYVSNYFDYRAPGRIPDLLVRSGCPLLSPLHAQ